MDGRRNKKKKERQEGGRNSGGKEERKKRKKKSSAGFKLVRLILLVFLSVEREGVVGRIGFTFLLSEPHSSLLFSLQSSSSGSFCSPLGL